MEPNIIIIFLVFESALKDFDCKSITLYFTICIVLNFNIILARIIAAKYLNIKNDYFCKCFDRNQAAEVTKSSRYNLLQLILVNS